MDYNYEKNGLVVMYRIPIVTLQVSLLSLTEDSVRHERGLHRSIAGCDAICRGKLSF